MERVDVECWMTNTTLLGHMFGESDATSSPYMLVSNTDDATELSGNAYLERLTVETHYAMTQDTELEASIAQAQHTFPVTEAEGGSSFSKFYGVDPLASKTLLIVYKTSASYKCITIPWQSVWRQDSIEESNQEKNLKLTIKCHYAAGKLLIHCETNRIPVQQPDWGGEYSQQPSSTAEGWEVVASEKRTAKILDEKEILELMIQDIKDLKFETILKAVQRAADEFRKYNYLKVNQAFPFATGSCRKTTTVLMRGRNRIEVWRGIIERFVGFLHLMDEEILEQRQDKYQDYDEGRDLSGSKKFFHFKVDEIGKFKLSSATKNLLSHTHEFMDLICSGFDLSKTKRIIQEPIQETDSILVDSRRDSKGEELRKKLFEFTATYLENPDHILMWFNKIAESILDRDHKKDQNIHRIINFLYHDYISKYVDTIRKSIIRNNKERESYFKVVVELVGLNTKSVTTNLDAKCIANFVTESTLRDVPNLANEFYKLLFHKSKDFSRGVYQDYFNSTLIAKDDKFEMMLALMKSKDGNISQNLSQLIGDFMLNPTLMRLLTLDDLFALFRQRYRISLNNFDGFLRNGQHCNMHRAVLKSIDLIIKDTQNTEADGSFVQRQADSYFFVLHKEIMQFMSDCLTDISICYLNDPTYQVRRLVEYLDDLKPACYGSLRFSEVVRDYSNRLRIIKDKLDCYIRVFEKNVHYLQEYDFQESFFKLLKDFRSDIDTYTIVQIETNEHYQDCICLKDSVWDVYHLCQEYQTFYQELKDRCTSNMKLVDYHKAIIAYCADLKQRILGFLDDSKYTLKDYHYHFRRIMWTEKLGTYEAATNALGISEYDRLVLFNHSRAFHALHKILKLKEPLEYLIRLPFLTLNSSPYITSVKKLFDEFRDREFDKITYSDLKNADQEDNILVTLDYSKCKTYQLPIVIRHIAASPNVLRFMKAKGTDFIKSMRDECDNENLDIINKLDVINKNLTFIVEEHSVDSMLDKLIALPKIEQRKLKQYLSSIEGLVESHIVHLADKTKKDTGYNRKIIGHILENSTLTLKYNVDQRDYSTVVGYNIGTTPFTVDSIELNELFNKAKIIVNENQNKEEQLDEYHQCMYDFNALGKELQNLTCSLKELRVLGLIDNRFKDLIGYLNSHTPQKCFSTNDTGDQMTQDTATELIIQFGRVLEGTQVLQTVNRELKKLGDRLTAEVYSYYCQECYLLTYFYGKKMYYLLEFLRGRLTTEDSEEVLNLVREAFPEETIKFNSNHSISDEPSQLFRDAFGVLKKWSEQLAPRHRIKAKTSCIFQLKKIVVVVDHVANKYMKMIKIMSEAGESLFSLSQVLFCRRETTKNEIYAFVKRSLLDPFKRIYFVSNIQVLDYNLLLEFRNIINKTIELESENVNYNLLVFADKTEYHKDLLENPNFCKDSQLEELDTILTDDDIRQKYSHVFTANQLVVSPVAGMGKTTYITEKSRQYELVDLFLAGELNKSTITRRLNNLKRQAHGKKKLAINIKLDFIEDFSVYSELVDYTLFCVSLVNRYYTDRGCRDLRGNLKQVFFEIGNTFSTELLLELATLKIFDVDPLPANAPTGTRSMHEYKVIIKGFSLDNVQYSADLDSDQQLVANFFNLCETGEFLMKSCTPEHMQLASEVQFRDLLKKHFMVGKSTTEKDKITYAQYSFWRKTLAKMVREMEKVTDLTELKLDQAKIPVEVRTEIASEINMFCSQVINLSVDQAKTSQDEMKKILSTLTKEKIKANKMEEYKTKFLKLEPWDSNDMVVPLFYRSRMLLAHTNMDLFNRQGSQRYRNRIHLKRFIRDKASFVDPQKISHPSEHYLKRLAELLGVDFDDIKRRSAEFMGGKGFSITRDNFMKMCLIIQKAELKTPIIMMGESGCGKTYVSQYTSTVLMQEELHELTLYSGVTEADFLVFLKKAISAAHKAAQIGKRVWVFFDEFNTSCLQSLVAEIMLDRRCPIDTEIHHIPENIVFISCCNPYRMKTKKADVGLVPKTTDNLLSHRVYPIPERLINFIWDFGQLSDKDEYNHLRCIVEASKIFDKQNVSGTLNFCNLIYTAHKFVRDIEERSGVSLRDIKRVIAIYHWFKGTLEFYEKNVQKKQRENSVINHLNAAIASIMVCYGLRLNGRPEHTDFIEKLVDSANQARSLGFYKTEEVKSILRTIAENHFQELENFKAGIIPDGIALNTPLKENFIAMLACFDTMTPLIICGAPGTSKTLCAQIFNSALTPNVIKNCKVFSRYKGINAMYYGGSQTSTSEGIAKVFHRGEKYLENKGEDTPVVVFDEIGLAELSPHNPLKILHPLLEKVNMEVGFLGLSNWTLDLSKMNRLVYLARPDMTEEDLYEIFKISIQKCTNQNIQTDLERFLRYLTTAYLKFREWQKKYGSHPNFHGSRDIYGVSKFIYRELQKIKHYDTSEKARELIKLAIERNFNGAMYLFGKESPTIPEDSVPDLRQGFTEEHPLSMIRVKELGTPYNANSDHLEASGSGAGTQNSSVIYSSAQVFKKLFVNEMQQQADPALQLFGTKFLAEHQVLELVEMNIHDKNARFLLIRTEGDVNDNIFLEKLRSLNSSDKIVDWRGIRGKEDSVELLSTLKSYISLGYVVVMKNLDELYGSLYDLFNQKYMEVDGRQYCYLYYGENKHRVEVHPDFKAVVLIPAEKELEGFDVELEQPAPFLNRFEKFFLRMSNILSLKQIKELVAIRNHLKKTVRGYSSRVLALSIDMLVSLCVNKKEVALQDMDKEIVQSGPNQAEPVLDKHRQNIMKLTTLNYLLYDNQTEEDLKHFLVEHPYSKLDDLFVDLSKRSHAKICLMTFSNPMEIEPVRENICLTYGINIHSSEEIYNLGLEKRSQLVKAYNESVFAVQFIYSEHLSMISQVKSQIEQNSKIVKTLFIIHLERDPAKRAILSTNIGLNFWNGWDNRVLDSIQHTDYKEFVQIRNLTFEELLLNTTYATGINLFKEAMLMCIIKITHQENDASLRNHMLSIRNMIHTNHDNIFIDTLREKLKTVQIFSGNSVSWVKAVRDRNSDRDFYVDLEVELLNYFKDQYSNQVKHCIAQLNDSLANIASYSIGFASSSTEVKQFFNANLKNGIKDCEITERQQKQAKGYDKNQQLTYFRLPFLTPKYRELQASLTKEIRGIHTAEFKLFGKLAAELKVALHQKVSQEKLQALRVRIGQAEKYLSQIALKVVGPIIATCKDTLAGLFDFPEIQNALSLDILSVVTSNIKPIHEHEMLQVFRAICFMINWGSADNLAQLFSTACILSLSFEGDIVLLLGLVKNSNLSPQQIDEFTKKLDSHTEAHKLDYGSIDRLAVFCQQKLIPEFSDPKLNLRVYREKYQTLIDRVMIESRDAADKDPNLYNFRALINLFGLLDILPTEIRAKHLSRLHETKISRERFGSDSHLDFVRSYILSIFLEISEIEDINLIDYCLILSEHISINAPMCQFELFLEDKYDAMFARFGPQETEKVSATLSFFLAKRIPSFYSIADLDRTLQVIQTDPVLLEYNRLFSSINLDKKRNLNLVVSFIDYLYIKGVSLADHTYEHEFIRLLNYIRQNADFSREYKSLKNLIFYSLLRVIFNSKTVREMLPRNPEWIQEVDQMFVDHSQTNEFFCNNPNSSVFTYWLQSIIREFGDLSAYQPLFKSVNNVCTLILEEDVQGTITFFERTIRAKFIALRDELDHASYNKDVSRVKAILADTHNGDGRIQRYMIGMALINKFVNQVKQTDEGVMQNFKESYLHVLNQVEDDPQYMQLLKMIVEDQKMTYSQFLADEQDGQFDLRLRKTFFQFMLVCMLFQSFGYDHKGWEKWQDKIDSSSFKCKVVNAENVNNYCLVATDIIKNRFSEGSGRKLGIYRCSCEYMYTIGNCGMAMETFKCPRCHLDIGGGDHRLLKREGHIEIQSIPELSTMITQQYYKHYGVYHMHREVNHSSIEFLPLKIHEIGLDQFLKKRNLGANDPFWNEYFCNMFIRHLFDHMLLTIVPETLTSSKAAFDAKMRKIVDYSNPEINRFYGIMSDKKVSNYTEYFLAHVKNDIEILSKELRFENPVDIFDWIRAVLTMLVEKMHQGQEYTESEIKLLSLSDVTEPKKLIILQEKHIQAMISTDISTKFIVKSLLFRKVDGDLLKGFMKEYKDESHFGYQFLRHNKFEQAKLFAEFNKQLEVSDCELLKQIVQHDEVLKAFPRIVKANLDLSYYLMSNYSRLYEIREAGDIDVLALADPRIKDLFREFEHIWEDVIPKHQSTSPQIFSFGYLCERNLNVPKFISDLRKPGGAKLASLVFVDTRRHKDKSFLYMKSILTTFIKDFHNMFVKHISKVLQIELDCMEHITPEFCDEESFVTSYDYKTLVQSNFWYNTEVSHENSIHFDLKRIEYLCAKAMQKKYINCEEDCLMYYEFKDEDAKKNAHTIKNKLQKIEKLLLDQSEVQVIDQMSEAQVLKTYDLVIEMGDYIYQNFLFSDTQRNLKSIIESIESSILKKRFNTYDEKLHSRLRVGHLYEYFERVQDKKFMLAFANDRHLYSMPLTEEQRQDIQKLVDDPNVQGDDLETIKIDIKDVIRDNYQEGKKFAALSIGDYLDCGEIAPGAEFIDNLTFGHFLTLSGLLNEGIMVNNHTNVVRRTSSNRSLHLEKRPSSSRKDG